MSGVVHQQHVQPGIIMTRVCVVGYPFGGGPRMCLGYPLARTELKLLLAVLFIAHKRSKSKVPAGYHSAAARGCAWATCWRRPRSRSCWRCSRGRARGASTTRTSPSWHSQSRCRSTACRWTLLLQSRTVSEGCLRAPSLDQQRPWVAVRPETDVPAGFAADACQVDAGLMHLTVVW